jgi:hypothetical protein
MMNGTSSVPSIGFHSKSIVNQPSIQGNAPKWEKLPGCSPAPPPQKPETEIKETGFVDMISKVLRDFPFSRNQPLKSADD